MALQDPDAQLVASVVCDDVAFGLELKGVDRERMARKVREALGEVELTDQETSEVAALSVGQRQGVAIAGLLAVSSQLLVFDESASMLDAEMRERFSALLDRLAAQGLAVVEISQNMEEAFQADRIAVMAEGSLVGCWTPDELLERPVDLETWGLAVPPVARLAQKLSAAGLAVAPTNNLDQLADELCEAVRPC